MRFRGIIEQQDVLILLDSGSACTFINEELASQFQHKLQPCEPLQFTTADGTPMLSDKCIPQFSWVIQGHLFAYTVRVLPLKCFDMIIGADWLEDHSPTWIHWQKKQMRFPVNGKRVLLKGATDDLSSCKNISVPKLKGLLRRKAILHVVEFRRLLSSANIAPVHSIQEPTPAPASLENIPPQIQQLLNKYTHLFQEPLDLPPVRVDDHHISLVPGAQPVNIRPYRYSPQQKNEIEKQIKEMLHLC